MFVGQLRLWNPDEPSTPRGSGAPQPASLEERLREACGELTISWDGFAGHSELLFLSEHLGLEVGPKLGLFLFSKNLPACSNTHP